MCVATSCGDDDTTEVQSKESITLRSQSIADGSEIDAEAVTSITLSYSTLVSVNPQADITLNGKKVKAESGQRTVMDVVISFSLEPGNHYTLSIPEGSIVSRNDATVSAPAKTIEFTTKKTVDADVDKSLVNSNSTAETKALFTQLMGYYGKSTLTGMMAEVNWNNTNSEKVKGWTGKYPAINCYDFIHLAWSPANWINYDDITPVKSWHDMGGIVACMWHWNVPLSEADYGNVNKMTCTPKSADSNGTSFKPSNCFVEGTWEKKIYDEDLAKVAKHLKDLQNAGIPVIWRPYHEAKGNYDVYQKGKGAWFWWGDEGPEVFKKLWIDMFNYFKQEGVNNLIWVFTDIPEYIATDWYPGDEYVDIVGVDIYNKTSGAACANVFQRLAKAYPTKMCTLSECGNVADLQSQWDAGAKWLWAMPWYDGGNVVHSDSKWWVATMGGSNIISLSNLK